ncbi:MAG: tetratricopeptide repeat protein [Bacteroidales bacterium]|nr:tetratricopeptide repeat protein [Bacteroidales bacterium]MCM1147347.1 tetratricopeptide repeat protein [Bacteroidales bacterium]MCM1206217.1 tetratricopeptide repeat protein [Bacillota bacterium]MCM1510451.1 tetratricopeptide repeat protein [Clostridium sp.]
MNAEEWYMEGNRRRQCQDWQGAMNCYQEAIELDSSSPAVHARQMLADIIEFYNKDMYNP